MVSPDLHPSRVLHALCDEELSRRFIAGEDGAYTALYQRYSARLLSYIHSLLGADNGAAEDVFQETFIRLYRERERYAEGASEIITNVGGWLFRVARNLSLNQLRSARYLTDLPEQYNEPLVVTVEEAHAGMFNDGLNDEALLEAVNAVVETLPSGLREVFILREINGMSYEETADIMGCTAEAARMRLSRARSAIRKALQPLLVDR